MPDNQSSNASEQVVAVFESSKIQERLDSIPAIDQAIDELFDRAKSVSGHRFTLAILDMERQIIKESSYRAFTYERGWVISEFGEFAASSFTRSTEIPEGAVAINLRRLNMIVYSQFWECLGIQRLIGSLVRLVADDPYDPCLLMEGEKTTYGIWKAIRERADGLNLQLAKVIKALYYNQIRNAFVHSEMYNKLGYITLLNFRRKPHQNIPSVTIQTWDALSDLSGQLIANLFAKRRGAERELKLESPLTISLPELGPSFNITWDDKRKRWLFTEFFDVKVT